MPGITSPMKARRYAERSIGFWSPSSTDGVSEQHPAANRSLHFVELLQRDAAGGFVDIHHHVADLVVGLQILRSNVDAAGGEDVVDLRQNARNILVDVQQAVLARV